METDGGADGAEVGGEVEEGGVVAVAAGEEVAGEEGVFDFVVAAEFGDAVVAHGEERRGGGVWYAFQSDWWDLCDFGGKRLVVGEDDGKTREDE